MYVGKSRYLGGHFANRLPKQLKQKGILVHWGLRERNQIEVMNILDSIAVSDSETSRLAWDIYLPEGRTQQKQTWSGRSGLRQKQHASLQHKFHQLRRRHNCCHQGCCHTNNVDQEYCLLARFQLPPRLLPSGLLQSIKIISIKVVAIKLVPSRLLP